MITVTHPPGATTIAVGDIRPFKLFVGGLKEGKSPRIMFKVVREGGVESTILYILNTDQDKEVTWTVCGKDDLIHNFRYVDLDIVVKWGGD